ncbi:MAG: hemolysin family protein [Oscillospiraceae bacterium]
MDPDGLSIFIMITALAASAVLAWCMGLLSADENDNDDATALGFSDRAAGIFTAFVFVCGFIVYYSERHFSFMGYWMIPIGIAAVMALIFFYAIGLARSDEHRTPPTALWQNVIGPIFTLPAKLIFKALSLEAYAPVTEKKLMSMMDDVEEQEIIDESQKEMITNIVELDDVTAGDIMTHRTEFASVEAATPASRVIALAREEGKSRIPVYRKTLDDIIGVIFIKDLLNLFGQADAENIPAEALARAAMFVPESCHAKELLIDFKRTHAQIAIVVDEYGGTAGLVTMEDVLEEIVGNIQDEYDNEEEELIPFDNGYIAAGSLDLEDVFDAFSLEMPNENDDNYDCVGGLIIDKLGRIPALGENVSITYGGIVFAVMLVGERRILKVRCTLAQNDDTQESDDE